VRGVVAEEIVSSRLEIVVLFFGMIGCSNYGKRTPKIQNGVC